MTPVSLKQHGDIMQDFRRVHFVGIGGVGALHAREHPAGAARRTHPRTSRGGHHRARGFFGEQVDQLIEYVRHDARLRQPAEPGKPTTRRQHYELLVERGTVVERRMAERELDGPELPESVEYLYYWALQLHGRSGVGMGGVVPLTYGTIADWARLTHANPTPAEVDALLRIDTVLCAPDASVEAD